MPDKKEEYYSKLVTSLKLHNYSDALGTIQDDLNLPAKTSYAEMEALLIFMVGKVYGNNRNTDIALMALGLLSGFDNREGNLETQQEKDMYRERREQFLLETNYISIQSKGKFNTYEDAKQAVRSEDKNGLAKYELDTIRSTLDSVTSRVLLKVVSSLYKFFEKRGTVDDYLGEAKSNFEKIAEEQNIGKISWTACDCIRKDLLPSLRFYEQVPSVSSQPKPIQKFAGLKKKIESPDSLDDTPPSDQQRTQFSGFSIAIIAILIVISVIAVVAFAIALIAIIQRDDAPRGAVSYPITIPYLTPAQQSCSLPVEGIVANNDGPIRLYPGAYTYIDVDVDPPEARYSLKYISENQDAVGASDGRIYAYENYAPASGALFEEVIIWIKPIKPASPEVETKVSVIVNYTKSMDELKHFAGSEVTSNISEPIS